MADLDLECRKADLQDKARRARKMWGQEPRDNLVKAETEFRRQAAKQECTCGRCEP